MNWGSVSERLMAVFAFATAYFAWATWRSAKKVEWFIGSQESHSTMTIRMQAKRDQLRVIAYDPSLTRYPGDVPLVGKEWPLDAVYLAIPPEFRSHYKRNWISRILRRPGG